MKNELSFKQNLILVVTQGCLSNDRLWSSKEAFLNDVEMVVEGILERFEKREENVDDTFDNS